MRGEKIIDDDAFKEHWLIIIIRRYINENVHGDE
jgi:hypothetical protein